MSQIEDPGLKPPEEWICIMLEVDQQDRCNAQTLFDKIQDDSLRPDARYAFVGLCCTEQEDTEESVLDSDYEPDLNLTTTEATTISSAMSHESLETRELAENAQHRDATNQLLAEDMVLLAATPPADLLALEQASLRGSVEPAALIKAEKNTSLPVQGLQLSRTRPANVEPSAPELQPRDVSTPMALSNAAPSIWNFSPHRSDNQNPSLLSRKEAAPSPPQTNNDESKDMGLKGGYDFNAKFNSPYDVSFFFIFKCNRS